MVVSRSGHPPRPAIENFEHDAVSLPAGEEPDHEQAAEDEPDGRRDAEPRWRIDPEWGHSL